MGSGILDAVHYTKQHSYLRHNKNHFKREIGMANYEKQGKQDAAYPCLRCLTVLYQFYKGIWMGYAASCFHNLPSLCESGSGPTVVHHGTLSCIFVP